LGTAVAAAVVGAAATLGGIQKKSTSKNELSKIYATLKKKRQWTTMVI